MALSPAIRVRVDERSGIAPARRAAERLADTLGFDEHRRGEVAIVVTELATNLVRHAGGGEIIVGAGPGRTVDAISVDRGPGITDPGRARVDGYSTQSGPGNGLGAIDRLSATMDMQTGPGQGTVIAVRLGGAPEPPVVDGIVLAKQGETASGDAWGSIEDRGVVTVLVADGLGHGEDAARASAAAVRELRPGVDPTGLLQRVHGALKPTRGAAGAVARFDRRTGALEYAGVGNISATIVNGSDTRSLVSLPGILGHGTARIRAFTYELGPAGLLVMHSDGCRSQWDLRAYPGAIRRDPLVVASLIVRDAERGNDDLTVVVGRADGR
jgi:anti-sigma regulatory factor (Ser/Thr protein kinase)